MDGRHLCLLLSLLELAVVHETEAELDENKDEYEYTDHLVCRVELLGLQRLC